jgi:hypothetical protein
MMILVLQYECITCTCETQYYYQVFKRYSYEKIPC